MEKRALLFKRGGVLVGLLLWFAAPLNAQQIVTAIHVQWDNNLNDNQPWQCVTTGEAANPWFHFIVAYKFPIINVMVDWAELQELTQAHPVQPTRQTNFSLQSGLPVGCTRPPVSDPQNWGIRVTPTSSTKASTASSLVSTPK